MKWNMLLGLAISLVLGWVMLYQIDFRQLLAALQSLQYILLVPVVLMIISTLWMRAWRWQYLMQPIKSIRTLPLFSATAIGFMANMVLPARTGELVRAYVIGQREQVSKVAAFATIVVERVLDLMSIVLISFLVVFFVGPLPEEVLSIEKLRLAGYLSVLLCILLLGSMWLLQAHEEKTTMMLSRALAWLPQRWRDRFMTTVQSFGAGLQALQTGWHLVIVLVLSLSLWTTVALSNLLILYAFDLRLPLYAAFFLLVVQTLGVAVPSSPGFIGTYHAAVVAGLALLGVSRELALSVAIIMHATFFFPFILLGAGFLWRERLSFGDLQSVKVEDS